MQHGDNRINDFPLLILAGGKSSRMGMPKGLIDYQKMPLIDYQINQFVKSGGRQIGLLLGYHVSPYVARYPWVKAALEQWITLSPLPVKIRVVCNPQPEKGQFSSLCWGLKSLLPSVKQAIFILPIDVPAPKPACWNLIASAFHPSISVVIPSFQGRGGHPILINVQLVQHLIEIGDTQPDARLDRVLQGLGSNEKVYVPVDDASIRDNLNSPDDLV